MENGQKLILGTWFKYLDKWGLVRYGLREHYSIFNGLPARSSVATNVAFLSIYSSMISDSESLGVIGGF